ncbi:hypothetical protein N7453_003496 [Penicillium expansum]|nr:hypothetical protein N7453_003496 [Penicillium expansum]
MLTVEMQGMWNVGYVDAQATRNYMGGDVDARMRKVEAPHPTWRFHFPPSTWAHPLAPSVPTVLSLKEEEDCSAQDRFDLKGHIISEKTPTDME